ncbi:phosphonate C-P lyase system protein PhnH [uncultured Roseobacter sp.]|uniref:phosphonate C-P lyase system protein PhnH n=1 Tax=uncultured Roseobacter sp. TaxID=114847 RepID=UPI0026226D94|nr:phosphonate C-P lyase system protein PhnH [uncultured Roseobacter sp.]
MQAQMLEGGFAEAPRDAAIAFRAAMRAMAMPGAIETLTGAAGPAPLSPAASVLLLTLCDPDTPIHLAWAHDTQDVQEWITFHTGAPFVAADQAMFALGSWEALAPHQDYAIGTAEYPDRAATLIVEMPALAAQGACLSGPGIETEAQLTVPDIAFSQVNARLYPLGVDMFLTHGNRVAALPRSTQVR